MPAPPSRIRAVLFDLGGTLVDYHDFAHWTDLARHCFVATDEEQVAHAFFDVERETDRRERVDQVEFWRRVLGRASERELDRSTAERFLGLLRERPGFYRLYSDTRRCLEDLRADGLRLAVVSNSSSEAHVRSILHGTGILPFFERVVSSGTEGIEKPEPEIFHRTLARMHLPPAEALYVGNLAFTDATAAREAGLHSVWLNRAGTGFGDDPPEITSLLEVPLCVWHLERGR
ncbi:MAG TPA: HAD family hydrolase [Thermoplasmata archaeon]|nr:HAD family hydrolase [Thermoplasmata archaeon]HTW76590.1 HAD family hydrolase [Thermoplasmata archaeon]